MAKNATKIARTANTALSASNKTAKLAKDASNLKQDAVNAAVAAACAAERACIATHAARTDDAALLSKLVKDARAAAEAAVEHAREAIRCEDGRDAVAAVLAANNAAYAAQRAGAFSVAADVIVGKKRELASDRELSELVVTVGRERKLTDKQRMKRDLAAVIDRAARYLVTYDGAIVATFANEEDAFLLEGELADLDQAHGVRSASCEVLERASGHRLGGYALTGGKMLVLLRDEEYERRYGRSRR